jgi:hypothetical protein
VVHELNRHKKWRLELAEEIAHKLRKFEGIEAIVVGGSVARGYADRHSDLEMPLFWETHPTDPVRKTIASDLGADFLTEYNGPAREDNLVIKDFQVDLWHNTVSQEEAVIDAVLNRFDTDLGSSNFMDTIRSCVPLYGQAVIQRWKQRAQAYPDGLALKNLRENIPYLENGHLEIHASRDNPTLVYGLISELQKRVFLILLALNQEYFPTFKWMYQRLEKMQFKPINVEARFRRAFSGPQDKASKDTFTIIEETLCLVERNYPQVDTASARRRLSSARIAHDTPVRL